MGPVGGVCEGLARWGTGVGERGWGWGEGGVVNFAC